MSEPIEQLADAIALGEGFALLIAVVDTVAEADRRLGELQRVLAALTRRPVVRLARFRAESEPADAEALSAVLDAMGQAEADVVVLDATGATNRDESAWEELFRRMNSRRNALSRALHRPLLLCLPPRLEVALAREAPDVWSVRSTRVRLDEPRAPSPSHTAELSFEEAQAAGLIAGLKRLFPDPAAALGMLVDTGIPASRLPPLGSPDFWEELVRGLDRGVIPGGLLPLARRVAADFGEVTARSIVLRRTGTRAEWVEELERAVLEREDRRLRREAPIELEERIDRLVARVQQGARVGPGAELAGARLVRPVGSGAFGTVWYGEALVDGRPLAVKVFHLERLADGRMLWHFRHGIQAMERLGRTPGAPPSLARVYQVEADHLAWSMPFCPGGDLEGIVKLRWSLDQKIAVFTEVCQAVAFAHAQGVIHRDIKPANVLLDAHGRPVLVDFDLAEIQGTTRLTGEGGLGTPMFAGPEQLARAADATERSDIYSLGRLLHYLLAEREPSLGLDSGALEVGTLPTGLVAVVKRACQPAPANRYPSVVAMLEDLTRHDTVAGTDPGLPLSVVATLLGADADAECVRCPQDRRHPAGSLALRRPAVQRQEPRANARVRRGPTPGRIARGARPEKGRDSS